MSGEHEEPSYFSVRVGCGEDTYTVYRFSGTERGEQRANEYAAKYNESLRKAMGLSRMELTVDRPDWINRPHEYDLAERVDTYRGESAMVAPRYGVPVVGDDDPMPTDYPHNY